MVQERKRGLPYFLIVFIVYNIVYDPFFYRMKWKYGLMELEFFIRKTANLNTSLNSG
jgi:hypothetical protein